MKNNLTDLLKWIKKDTDSSLNIIEILNNKDKMMMSILGLVDYSVMKKFLHGLKKQ